MSHAAEKDVRWLLAQAAAAALGFGTIAAPAGAADAPPAASRHEMLSQIRSLRERLEQLEENRPKSAPACDAEPAGGRPRADVEPDLGHDLLADADARTGRRASLLAAGGFSAGYTNGRFVIQSADGGFLINPNLWLQVRYVGNYAERPSDGDGGADFASGFELRRTKFAFDGNAFGTATAYKFQWQTNRRTGGVSLEDAWVRHKFADTWAVRAGQFVEPLFHEQLVSAKRQLATDRSMLNETLGTGSESYIQGVSLVYDDNASLRAELCYHDGIQSLNTGFVDAGGAGAVGITAPDFGVTGRVEYKAFGDWKQYDDFTARDNRQGLLVFGAAADFTEAGDMSAVFHTADVQWEPKALRGLSLYAAYVGVYREFGATSSEESSPYDFGVLAQVGYMVTEKCEVFARYDYVRLDDNAPASLNTASAAYGSDNLHEITVGTNYYIRGHAAKLTLDATWLPNGSPVAADGVGIVGQEENEEQFVLRAQFQLLI